MIKESFIPVALDSYVPGNSAEAAFFKKVNAGVNYFNYVTAAGTVLGSDDCHDMKSHMKEALERYKRLPEGERKPKVERPEGTATLERAPRVPPPGGLIARVYCTYLDRDSGGELSRAKRLFANVHDGAPTMEVAPSLTWVDMMWLTSEEWKSLVPASAEKGARVSVPRRVQRRFFRYYAADLFRRPIEPVRSGELTLTVEASSAEGVALRLDGYARTGAPYDASDPKKGYVAGTVGGDAYQYTKHHGAEFRFLGFLNYDVRKKAFDRFDVVALGEAWGFFTEGYTGGGEHRRRPLGIAFELVSGERPADRVTPFGALPYAFGDSYFKEE